MSWTTEAQAAEGGMTERAFTLAGDNGDVPGVYWEPAEGGADALVLLGHGGTTHKRVPYLIAVAQLLAARGVASAAIDGPGHGDRLTIAHTGDNFKAVWDAGGGTEGMLADWRAALDFLHAETGERPTGWWGLSMGTMMGLPVCARDERIRTAVLGLMGTWGPNGAALTEMAPKLTLPLRFLVQWDDEIVPRDACLELFGLIGAKRKTLHANPGLHAAVPQFEVAASADYLASQLRR
ncbi:MAG: alpha/beta fold hydrolase [Pseudomonadota bacterium]